MAKHYWAVRPKSMPDTIRIEHHENALDAYVLAFGRGNPHGAYEAKDLGTRVAVIQSDRQRIALLRSPDGWVTLGITIEEYIRRKRLRERENQHG